MTFGSKNVFSVRSIPRHISVRNSVCALSSSTACDTQQGVGTRELQHSLLGRATNLNVARGDVTDASQPTARTH